MTDLGPIQTRMHDPALVQDRRPSPDLKLRDAGLMDMYHELTARLVDKGALVIMLDDGSGKVTGGCAGAPHEIAMMLAQCLKSIPGNAVSVHVGTTGELRTIVNRLDPQTPAAPRKN